MRISASILFGIFILLVSTISYSQSDSTQWSERFSLYVGTGASNPMGAFDRKYNRTPWSISAQLGVKPVIDRFQFIEIEVNYQRLARFQNIFPVQSPQGGLFDLNHSSRSNLLFLGAGYRFEFDQLWYFIPRISFSFGACNAYVFTSLKDNFTDEVIENYRQASDWSYYSSLEMGFSVPVYPGFQVSLLATYLKSGSMDVYLPLQEPLLPSPVDPFENFELRRSVIDLLAIEIGLTLYFNSFF